jgi:hypothetical protein
MDKLGLSESFSFFESTYFLILKFNAFVCIKYRYILMLLFLEDRHAERYVTLYDHIDVGRMFSLIIDDWVDLISFKFECFGDISDDFILLDWIFKDLFEYVQWFKTLG